MVPLSPDSRGDLSLSNLGDYSCNLAVGHRLYGCDGAQEVLDLGRQLGDGGVELWEIAC